MQRRPGMAESCLVVLAMGAAAMATGMRDKALVITGLTVRAHQWTERGAARCHRRQRVKLAGQCIRVAGQEIGLKGLDDR